MLVLLLFLLLILGGGYYGVSKVLIHVSSESTYECDPDTGMCTPKKGGTPFKTCKVGCAATKQSQDKAYTCQDNDGSLSCREVPPNTAGSIPNLSTCQASGRKLADGSKAKCANSTWECKDFSCQENTEGLPVNTSAGIYSSKSQCVDNCKPKYTYNTETNLCETSTAGDATDKAECIMDNIPNAFSGYVKDNCDELQDILDLSILNKTGWKTSEECKDHTLTRRHKMDSDGIPIGCFLAGTDPIADKEKDYTYKIKDSTDAGDDAVGNAIDLHARCLDDNNSKLGSKLSTSGWKIGSCEPESGNSGSGGGGPFYSEDKCKLYSQEWTCSENRWAMENGERDIRSRSSKSYCGPKPIGTKNTIEDFNDRTDVPKDGTDVAKLPLIYSDDMNDKNKDKDGNKIRLKVDDNYNKYYNFNWTSNNMANCNKTCGDEQKRWFCHPDNGRCFNNPVVDFLDEKHGYNDGGYYRNLKSSFIDAANQNGSADGGGINAMRARGDKYFPPPKAYWRGSMNNIGDKKGQKYMDTYGHAYNKIYDTYTTCRDHCTADRNTYVKSDAEESMCTKLDGNDASKNTDWGWHHTRNTGPDAPTDLHPVPNGKQNKYKGLMSCLLDADSYRTQNKTGAYGTKNTRPDSDDCKITKHNGHDYQYKNQCRLTYAKSDNTGGMFQTIAPTDSQGGEGPVINNKGTDELWYLSGIFAGGYQQFAGNWGPLDIRNAQAWETRINDWEPLMNQKNKLKDKSPEP